MTVKQRIVKIVYPLIASLGRSNKEKNFIYKNTQNITPPVSFYTLKAIANNGQEVNFDQYKGKKVIIVNVASFCGYTPQYDMLEKLYQQHTDKLVILGFPTNNFEQEPDSDEAIAQFCRMDYGVTFPLFKKISVLKNEQHPVYAWLTEATANGWNNQMPTWNFCKYLVDERGMLVCCFGSAISPDSKEMKEALGI